MPIDVVHRLCSVNNWEAIVGIGLYRGEVHKQAKAASTHVATMVPEMVGSKGQAWLQSFSKSMYNVYGVLCQKGLETLST